MGKPYGWHCSVPDSQSTDISRCNQSAVSDCPINVYNNNNAVVSTVLMSSANGRMHQTVSFIYLIVGAIDAKCVVIFHTHSNLTWCEHIIIAINIIVKFITELMDHGSTFVWKMPAMFPTNITTIVRILSWKMRSKHLTGCSGGCATVAKQSVPSVLRWGRNDVLLSNFHHTTLCSWYFAFL